MRHWSGIALVVALAALAPQSVMAILAGATSVLFEALPYLVAAAVLTPLAGRFARPIVAYAGCGCGARPSARSIPAAVATAALFGPVVAFGRVAAASLTARLAPAHDHVQSTVLGELLNLAPMALLAAGIMFALPALPLRGIHPALLWLSGALLGVIASPCALGGIALAGALRVSAPLAAVGVLCTAGLVPGFRRRHAHPATHDAFAYLLFALACAAIAIRHGGTFVHPRMTIPLALCAVYCAAMAIRFRASSASSLRTLGAVALAVIVIGAPQPIYRATETTLADAFAGERVDFRGVAVHDQQDSALVRYAITCCRADAAPVAIALDRNLAAFNGRWLRAQGTLERDGAQLRLHIDALTPIAPPGDPFIYR